MPEAEDFSRVLDAELEHVRISRKRRGVNQPVAASSEPHKPDADSNRALDSCLFGVALSGGGIRSATFALGVLQGLADRGLLRQVDYLSTVSGGGYIGSWLLSRIKRQGGPRQVQEVEEMLTSEHASHPERADQTPIHFLRQYSNYLTPRLGLLSADVWTMGATWFRNTFLNLLMLVAAIGAALLIPRLAGFAFLSCGASWSLLSDSVIAFSFLTPAAIMLWRQLRSKPPWTTAMARKLARLFVLPVACGAVFLYHAAHPFLVSFYDSALTLLFLVFGTIMLCRGVSPPHKWTQGKVLGRIMLPYMAGAAYLVRWLWSPESQICVRPYCIPRSWFYSGFFWADLVWIGVPLAFLFFAVALMSRPVKAYRRLHPQMPSSERNFWLSLIVAAAAMVPAFVVFLGLRGAGEFITFFPYLRLEPWMLWTWAPPAALALLSLGVTLQIGLLGLDAMELDAREWLARLRAWSIIFSFGWVVIVGGSIYGPWLLLVLGSTHPWTSVGLTGAWLATTVAGVLSGKSAKSSGESGTLGTGSGGGIPAVEWTARIAPFVFMAGFVLLLALGVHVLTAPGGITVKKATNPAAVKINVAADSGGSGAFRSPPQVSPRQTSRRGLRIRKHTISTG